MVPRLFIVSNRISRESWRNWTLFLDRDGVINRKIEGDYVRTWNQFDFLPHSKNGLKKLCSLFKRLIVVTNQRVIGKKIISIETLNEIHVRMLKELEGEGVRIDAIYSCPHDITDHCSCRKPEIGLFLKAKQDFPDIDFQKSIFLGDSPSDWEVAKKVGAVAIGIGPSSHKKIPFYQNLLDCYQGFLKRNL